MAELVRSRHSSRAERARCPACLAASEAETNHLSTLKRFADDRELQDAYQRSDGYCIPHYRLITAELESVPQWLLIGQSDELRSFVAPVARAA